jgi:hypothetical protein
VYDSSKCAECACGVAACTTHSVFRLAEMPDGSTDDGAQALCGNSSLQQRRVRKCDVPSSSSATYTASVTTDMLTCPCSQALHNRTSTPSSQLDGQWRTLYRATAIVLCLSAHFCTAVILLGTAVLCVSSHRLKSSSYGVAAPVTIVTGVLEVVIQHAARHSGSACSRGTPGGDDGGAGAA